MQSGRCDHVCLSASPEERALLGRVPNEGRNHMQPYAIREMQSGRCNPGNNHGGAREPSPSAVDGLALHRPAPRHLWGEARGGRRGEHLHARTRSTGQPHGTEYAAAESASMRFVKYEKGANEKSGIMRSRCSLETRALESRGTRPHLCDKRGGN